MNIDFSGIPLSGAGVLAKATESMRFFIQYKPLRTPEGQDQFRVIDEEDGENEWHLSKESK